MMLNMLAMPSQIELYEQMRALSGLMVEAARDNDWDRLIELENNVAALRNRLIADEGGQLAPDEVEQKRHLIRTILQDDAEVRRHTEPWMEHVRQFLGGEARKQRIDRAYGAGS